MKTMTDGAVLARLCDNIATGRFDWRKYCTPRTYFGREICVTPLHCSYGQIGNTVHFPYSSGMPQIYNGAFPDFPQIQWDVIPDFPQF